MSQIYKSSNSIAVGLAAMAVAGTALAMPAQAADVVPNLGTQTMDPVLDPVQSSSIWNGAYAGLYGGLKWQSVGVMGDNDVDLNQQKEIGGYVGINQALGNSLVGGLEWMGGYSGASESEGGVTVEQDWETSLRARMGFAVEQNLVYGLAGVNATRLEVAEGGASDSKWLKGWTVGAGVERQFTDMITGKIEYDYTRYGEREFKLGTADRDVGLSGHGVKVGVGVNF